MAHDDCEFFLNRWKHWILILESEALSLSDSEPVTSEETMQARSLLDLLTNLVATSTRLSLTPGFFCGTPIIGFMCRQWNMYWRMRRKGERPALPLRNYVPQLLGFIEKKWRELQTIKDEPQHDIVKLDQKRKQRWVSLTVALAEADKDMDICGSWPVMKRVLQPTWKSLDTENVHPTIVQALKHHYATINPAMSYLVPQENRLRMQLMMPILVYLCQSMDGVTFDPNIFIEGFGILERIIRLSLIIRRGNTSIMFSQAGDDDMDDAVARVVIACEIFAEGSGVDVIYGIASSFLEWQFVRCSNAGIEMNCVRIVFDDSGSPTSESLLQILNRMKRMLKDD